MNTSTSPQLIPNTIIPSKKYVGILYTWSSAVTLWLPLLVAHMYSPVSFSTASLITSNPVVKLACTRKDPFSEIRFSMVEFVPMYHLSVSLVVVEHRSSAVSPISTAVTSASKLMGSSSCGLTAAMKVMRKKISRWYLRWGEGTILVVGGGGGEWEDAVWAWSVVNVLTRCWRFHFSSLWWRFVAPLQQRCLGLGDVAVALHRQPSLGADSFTAAVASWLDVGVVVAAALAPAAEEAKM